MKNFKKDSTGGEAVGQKCKGKGSGNGTDACEIAGFSADKRILYEKDMVTELDLALQYDYAREQGEAIGEARGRAEGKAEEKSAIARRMLEDGVPAETVAKYSGLSAEEVRAITR